MNTHILLGIITFLTWSTFSTWYYVTKIKGFPKPKTETVEEQPVPPIDTTTVVLEADITSMEPEKEVVAIQIASTLYFDKNSTTLVNPSDLSELVDNLTSSPLPLSVSVIGHTCDLGTATHNKELSMQRAQTVLNQLSVLKLDQQAVEIQAMGESSPSVPNTSEPNRQKNRRVELTITN